MAKKKIYKHHQRASFSDAQTDAQSREMVLGGTLRKAGVKFQDGQVQDLTPLVDLSAFSSFAQAITDIGSSTVTLVVSSTITVSATANLATSCPNATVRVHSGGLFNVASGQELTLGRVEAGHYPICSGSGTINITSKTPIRSAAWYGCTGDGSTSDSTAAQMAADDLKPNCELIFPSPASFYRLTAVLEFADLQGCVVRFGAAPDNALPAYPNYPFKYDGTTLTGYENPVVRVVGCTRTKFYGLSVHANSKADYGLWFSGLNSYTGSAPATANRYRSIGCQFHGFAATGCNVSAAWIGEETSTSSQTDLATFYESYFSVGESATQVALDEQPATFGMKGVGANTYVNFSHCQFTGDFGAYCNAGSYYFGTPLFLGDAGLYINAKTCDVTMLKPYAEGFIGRPVWLDSGDGTDAKNLNIIGAKFFPGSKATATIDTSTDVAALSKTFDGSTNVNTTTNQIAITAHGFVTGDPIYVDLGAGTFPVASPVISTGSRLWAIRVDADNFQLSRTQGGSAIDFTSAGSGTITLRSGAITETSHPYVTGDKLIYSDGGGTTIPGLTDNGAHYAIRLDANRFTVASSLANAQAGTFIDITGAGVGASHTFTWRPAPMRFQSNMNVTMMGCFAEDWITDNAGSTGQKPVYVDIGNTWLHPTDHSANPDIRLMRYSTFAGAGVTEALRFIHNPLWLTVDATAGGETMGSGWSCTNVVVTNSGSGAEYTLSAAKKGMAVRVYRLGEGALTVNEAASNGVIKRHDGQGTATTYVRAVTKAQLGFIEFVCVVDGEWWPISTMELSYDGSTKYLTASTTWDPGNVVNGAATAVNVTVTGAEAGDFVLVSHDQLGSQNVILQGFPTTDNVRVVLVNHNGADLDVASGTLKVKVIKP